MKDVFLLRIFPLWLILFLSNGLTLCAQTNMAPSIQLEKTHNLLGNDIVPFLKVSTNKVIHRFHDTSPLSPSGRYIALLRIPFEDRYPEPGEPAEIVIVDMKTMKEQVVDNTFGWEMQVGANVQWGANDKELFYTNVDTNTWNPYTVKMNPISGESIHINGMMFMVSLDGKKLVSHNLINSVRAQSGYGVIVPKHLTNDNIGLVDTDGIFVTDTETGISEMIVSIKEIYKTANPGVGISNPEIHSLYCFKAMWNPRRSRIITCLIGLPLEGGKRKVSVITMRSDGSDIRTAITAEQYSKGGHHMAWMPDGEHLSMNLNVDDEPGLELITVKYNGDSLNVVYPVGSGHPSFHPGGLPFVITDSYRNEPVTNQDGFVPIRLINIESGKEVLIASVYIPNVQNSAFRVDPHPTWDRSGRYIIFNAYEDNTRCVFIADLKKLLKTNYWKKI